MKYFRRIGFALLLVLISGAYCMPLQAAPAKTTIRSKVISKQKYVLLSDVFKYYRMTGKYYSNRMEFSGQGNTLKLYFTQRAAYINQIPVTLNFPLKKYQGNWYITYNDLVNTFEPLLRPSSVLKKGSVKTILIDPGHGGKSSPGALGKKSREKEITLAIARKLKPALEKAGYRVLMTRNADKDVSLDSRAAMGGKVKADLMISLHLNSSSNKSVRGIEVFAVTPIGAPGSYSSKTETAWVAGDSNAKNSYFLAALMQKHLIARTGASNRGVKRARFVVLRDSAVPSVLLELNFISNVTDEKNMLSAAYQNKIVSGIVDAVQSYKKTVQISSRKK